MNSNSLNVGFYNFKPDEQNNVIIRRVNNENFSQGTIHSEQMYLNGTAFTNSNLKSEEILVGNINCKQVQLETMKITCDNENNLVFTN